ncbi:MAG: hypothetical protein U0271_02190 [Polyangiaceae bacterium]
MLRPSLALAALFAIASACSPAEVSSGPTAPASSPSSSRTSSAPAPSVTAEAPRTSGLAYVLLLHGLGGSGRELSRLLGMDALSRELGFVYEAPDGEPDARGERFWNAGPACCDFAGQNPDHVARLGAMLEKARKDPRIDPSRLVVLGYSNGGFMAHRLGCELAGINSIVSIAGAASWPPSTRCPAAPRRVVEVHGDADPVVRFDGGLLFGKPERAYPSVDASVGLWQSQLGCSDALVEAGQFDLESALEGAETTLSSGCDERLSVYRVRGGDHSIVRIRGLIHAALVRALAP